MRLVVAEDEPLLREGLVRLLTDEGFEVVGQAGNADAALSLVAAHSPDVLITDVRMPPTHTDEGLRAAEELAVERPELGLLVLSHFVEARYALRVLQRRTRGVGYLLKHRVSDLSVLSEAVRRVADGHAVVDPEVVRVLGESRSAARRLADLTDRERELLTLMAEGRSNRGIERELVLSPKTVESHVRSIFSKLGLPPVAEDHRRVLAVIEHMRSRGKQATSS